MRALTYLPLAACILFTLPTLAQTTAQAKADAKATTAADATMRRMSQTRAPGRVAISPDATQLAYTLRGKEGTELHLVPMPAPGATIDQSKDKLISASEATNCSNNNPTWSPDSKTLAFTSTCTAKEEKPGQEQIFLFTTADGKVRQLTHITGNINQPAWSPDGKSIAFLFVENATRSAGALDAMKPLVGVIGEDTFEVQTIYCVNVGDGYGGSLGATLETLGKGPSKNGLYAYEFSWSPDSRKIAFVGANPPGENNWWVAKLYTQEIWPGWPESDRFIPSEVVLDPATTTTPLHGLQIAVPRFSPDGKRIAVIGGLMSDQGSTGGDIWIVNSDGKGQPIDITPQIDGTPTWEVWLDNHTVGFVEDRRGHILLTDADADKHIVIPHSSDDLGEVSVGGGPIKNALSGSNTGILAYVQSGLTQAPEIWGGPVTSLHPLTHFNEGLPTPTNKVESVEWENEGFHVQGWLAYPKDYDPTRHYPIIVTVHGGPSASTGPRYGASLWPGLGYFEFQPNPRGSFGQGEAFTAANIKDFGYGDLRDIETGLDAIEKRIPAIDHNREGLTGWSYGGFMTMFGVTQTTRFKAAVAGAGIANWQSYYGENSIDQWMVPFFGATVYDDPAVYAKSSAITFIKNVKTPTLIIVGDRDGECPAPQSFEFWHALRDLGVKTQLVVYPNEGHGFRDPAHIKDRTDREIKWFADNMK